MNERTTVSNRIVVNFSDFLQETEPNTKGFSSQNLWRMKQFYETYQDNKKLSPLVREIGWTNNTDYLSKCTLNIKPVDNVSALTIVNIKKALTAHFDK